MPWGVEIYASAGQYHVFTMADDIPYDMMKDTLSSEKGRLMYGMRHVAGRKGITDEQIDAVSPRIQSIVERINGGETLDLEAELDACFRQP